MRTHTVPVLLSILAACGSNAKSGSTDSAATITFASNIDQTGSLGSPTRTAAIEFAVREANQGLEKAGEEGFKFQVVTNDSMNTPSVAIQQAREAVTMNHAVAVIADTSQDDIATNGLNYAADVSTRLGVPVVCMACTSPSINNPAYTNANDSVDQATRRDDGHWNYRTTMKSTLEAKVLIGILLEQGTNGDVNGDGIFKVSTYASDEAYGQGFEGDMRAAIAAQAPLAIIESLRHPGNADPATYDWAGGLARLTDNQTETASGTVTDVVPDAIVEMSFPELIIGMMDAYIAGGFTTPFFHTHNTRTQTVLDTIGSAFNGNRGTSHVTTDGDSGTSFGQRWRIDSGSPPAFWDANAYDAAMVIMLASVVAMHDSNERDPAQLTGAEVRDAFAKLNDKSASATIVLSGADGFAAAVAAIADGGAIDYAGASGPLDFDNGNVLDKIVDWNVEFSQFVDKTVYDCVASDACTPVR